MTTITWYHDGQNGAARLDQLHNRDANHKRAQIKGHHPSSDTCIMGWISWNFRNQSTTIFVPTTFELDFFINRPSTNVGQRPSSLNFCACKIFKSLCFESDMGEFYVWGMRRRGRESVFNQWITVIQWWASLNKCYHIESDRWWTTSQPSYTKHATSILQKH